MSLAKAAPMRLTLVGTPADIALTIDVIRLFGVILDVSQRPCQQCKPTAPGIVHYHAAIDIVGPIEPLRPYLAHIGRYHTDPDAFMHNDLPRPTR